MIENFMDYSCENCQYLFTYEQALKMRANIEEGSFRRPLVECYVYTIYITYFFVFYFLFATKNVKKLNLFVKFCQISEP